MAFHLSSPLQDGLYRPDATNSNSIWLYIKSPAKESEK